MNLEKNCQPIIVIYRLGAIFGIKHKQNSYALGSNCFDKFWGKADAVFRHHACWCNYFTE